MRWLCLLTLAGCATAPTPFAQFDQMHGQTSAPAGNVVLEVVPPDAEVAVDGVTQGRGGDFDGVHGALNLTEGMHRLAISSSGYRTFNSTVFATASGKQTLQVSLDKQ